MKPREQLIAHFQQLQQHNKQLALALEKYRQQTEYVCLKTYTPDWPAFLAAVRTGRIAPTSKQPPLEGAALALLDGLFSTTSKHRNTGRQAFCQCESPVCSEGTVRHVKGSDTSRSEQSEEVVQNGVSFEGKQVQEESVQQILKYIEQYQQQKMHSLEGFNTFRKPDKEESLNETAEHSISNQNPYPSSGRNYNQQTNKIELPFKPVWKNKENIDVEIQEWRPSVSNQYLLSVENTRLRKQLRDLESRFLG